MIAFFTGSILVSVGGDSGMSAAQTGLDRAVRFYPDGFSKIHESISNLIKGDVDDNKKWTAKDDFWMPLLEHFVFATMFWGFTILALIKIVGV
jgi:hypothetical protein